MPEAPHCFKQHTEDIYPGSRFQSVRCFCPVFCHRDERKQLVQKTGAKRWDHCCSKPDSGLTGPQSDVGTMLGASVAGLQEC